MLALADIGALLASVYSPTSGDVPTAFIDLLDHLEGRELPGGPVRDTLSDREFRLALERNIPQLRSFAFALTRNRDAADDLAQEAMLKAWAARDRFQPGTNIRAWTYTILRNLFYSERRRDKFNADWDESLMSRLSAAPASQEQMIHVRDVAAALERLVPAQREALMLVGAAGMSYEEAASVVGTAVGTIKSRVSRARDVLSAAMDGPDICGHPTQSGTPASPRAAP